MHLAPRLVPLQKVVRIAAGSGCSFAVAVAVAAALGTAFAVAVALASKPKTFGAFLAGVERIVEEAFRDGELRYRVAWKGWRKKSTKTSSMLTRILVQSRAFVEQRTGLRNSKLN